MYFVFKSCPGDLQDNLVESSACRLMVLGDGTIVQQVMIDKLNLAE